MALETSSKTELLHCVHCKLTVLVRLLGLLYEGNSRSVAGSVNTVWDSRDSHHREEDGNDLPEQDQARGHLLDLEREREKEMDKISSILSDRTAEGEEMSVPPAEMKPRIIYSGLYDDDTTCALYGLNVSGT